MFSMPRLRALPVLAVVGVVPLLAGCNPILSGGGGPPNPMPPQAATAITQACNEFAAAVKPAGVDVSALTIACSAAVAGQGPTLLRAFLTSPQLGCIAFAGVIVALESQVSAACLRVRDRDPALFFRCWVAHCRRDGRLTVIRVETIQQRIPGAFQRRRDEMAEGTAPAGWYPDTTKPGQQRYWDGNAWTDHVAPLTPTAPRPRPPPPTHPGPDIRSRCGSGCATSPSDARVGSLRPAHARPRPRPTLRYCARTLLCPDSRPRPRPRCLPVSIRLDLHPQPNRPQCSNRRRRARGAHLRGRRADDARSTPADRTNGLAIASVHPRSRGWIIAALGPSSRSSLVTSRSARSRRSRRRVGIRDRGTDPRLCLAWS